MLALEICEWDTAMPQVLVASMPARMVLDVGVPRSLSLTDWATYLGSAIGI